MHCSGCQKEAPDDAKFCPHCGQTLELPSYDAVVGEAPPSFTPEPSTFVKGGKYPLEAGGPLVLGLQWDPDHRNEVDLDASAIVFGRDGRFIESVYFGCLESTDGAIKHEGDSTTGAGDGDDETITIDLDRLSGSVGAVVLVVSSYSGMPLGSLETAVARVCRGERARQGVACGAELGRFALGMEGNATGMIAFRLYKENGTWTLHAVGAPAQGRNFGDLVPVVQEGLRDIIPGVVVQPRSQVVVLSKGESVPLKKDDGGALDRVCLGLGWDAARVNGKDIDLDASAVLFDQNNQEIEAVYFKRLRSSNGAVVHTGDNRTGAGDGDDEQIIVNLNALPARVAHISFVVNSYTGQAFQHVRNAYVRLVDLNSGAELMRYHINDGGAGHAAITAMLMCRLYRARGAWQLKALGVESRGSTYRDNLTEMRREIQNRLPLGSAFRLQPPRGQQTRNEPLPGWAFQLLILLAVLLVFYLSQGNGGSTSASFRTSSGRR